MMNRRSQSQSRWCAALVAGTVLAGAVGAVSLTPVTAQAAEKQTVSKEIGKTLLAAQTALKERRYSEAISKLKDAESYGKKTPWDQHVINTLAGGAYQGAKQYPEAIKRYEAQLTDGFTSEAEQQKLVKALTVLQYQQGAYDKAIEYGNRAIKGGFADESIRTVVVQSYYQKRDYKATQKLLEESLAAQVKKGETPKEDTLQLLRDACAKQSDRKCQTEALEKLVTYYPKPVYWETLLYELNKTQMADPVRLQLYRLMLEVGVLKDNKDYTEMAQMAMEQGAPGESQQILQKGFDAKLFPDARTLDKNKRLFDAAKKADADNQAKLAAATKSADSADTGDAWVKIGYGYLGDRQYDKAADALNKGLAKGKLEDGGAQAHLLLGIAQLKSGHKDEAIKSWHAVKGDPVLERIANLWALHAKQPESVARR